MSYDLPRATLGRTGLSVTRLGIGGAYCQTVEGYQAALDCGVNYVDTARAYRDGKDEEVIGQAIAGRRDKLILATKTLQREAALARRDLETSLKCLGTDYIDIWQLHHLNTEADRKRALGPDGAYEAALKAREEGLVRFIGVTGHDWAEIGKAVASGLFDTVLCWYNCAMKEPEQLVFPQALAHGTGVIIMNASRNEKLFGGPGAPEPADFYRYVLSHEAVQVTLMALRDVNLFQRVAQALEERSMLDVEEKRRLEEYGSRMRTTGKLD